MPYTTSSPINAMLTRAGFSPVGKGVHRMNGFKLSIDDSRWATISAKHAGEGPWKCIGRDKPSCDIPWFGNPAFMADTAAEHIAEYLDWICQPPTRSDVPALDLEQLDQLLANLPRTIQSPAGQVRAIDTISGASGMLFRCTLASAVDLDADRLAALDTVIADANRRWRLVSFAADDQSITAKVNLMHIPPAVALQSRLVAVAHQCLCSAAVSLIDCVTVLADTSTNLPLVRFIVNRPAHSHQFQKEIEHEHDCIPA